MQLYKIRNNLKEEQKAKSKSDFIYTVLILVLILVMAFIIYLNNFVFIFVEVRGRSMNNTLNDGDSLVVNVYKQATYKDIVVIKGESSNGWLIKRVIAKGGDTVKIENHSVYIKYSGKDDFVLLKEDYAIGKTDPASEDVIYICSVNKNEYFYLGDNRENSSDSRTYGTCKSSQIVGVVENWSIELKEIRNFFLRLFT